MSEVTHAEFDVKRTKSREMAIGFRTVKTFAPHCGTAVYLPDMIGFRYILAKNHTKMFPPMPTTTPSTHFDVAGTEYEGQMA